MIRKSTLLLICLLWCHVVLNAQDRYMVFFTDKAGSPYSLDNPSAFLSERAIYRRSNQRLSINEQDLPVVEAYVEALCGLGVTAFYRTKWFNGVLVQMDNQLVDTVLALDFVSSVEFVAPGATLNDGSAGGDGGVAYEDDEALSDFQNEMLGINVDAADKTWGNDRLIAVFDEGFRNVSNLNAFRHIYDENRLLYTFDFTNNEVDVENTANNHGTRVLSTMAAYEPGELIGTAPGASYILCTTEDDGEYRSEEYYWLFAAEKADSAGVDIINTSLGYYRFSDPNMDYSLADMDGQTAVITRASNLAAERGIFLVTSAGNTGLDQSWPIITAPADSPNVLAVGAVNAARDRARVSSTGPTADDRIKPDVMALGIATAVIGNAGSATFSDGTSFAAPLVAGLAARVWQIYRPLTAAQLMNIIRLSADNFENPNNEIGYGIPDISEAFELASNIDRPVLNEFKVHPNPTGGRWVALSFETSQFSQNIQVEIFNNLGSLVNQQTIYPSIRKSTFIISLGDGGTGMYLLRITSPQGTTVKRVIRQ